MNKVIDFGVFRERKIQVAQTRYPMTFPKPETVTRMDLIKAATGEPAVLIVSTGGRFTYTITDGFAIHLCNEFFRKFGFDIEVTFKTYSQYGMLIWEMNDLIKRKRKAP